MQTLPSISCILPVFNGESYLRETLDCIFSQTLKASEVVVVDDGSTDTTPAILDSYGERVRVLRQDNRGPSAARNRGLQMARGECVVFADADDLWPSEKLERQMSFLAAHAEFAVCCAHARNFWIPELRDEAEALRDRRISQPVPAYLASTMLAWRWVFERVGTFDETLAHGHSTDWFLRAKEHGVSVAMLPDVLLWRRLHHSNRSRVFGTESREEFLTLVKRHLDRGRGRAADAAPVGGDEHAAPEGGPANERGRR